MLTSAGKPRTARELSESIQVDPGFLDRILRHLSTGGVVDKKEENYYAANGLTYELSTPRGSGFISFILENTFPYFARIPHSLAQRSWDLSNGNSVSLWREASGTNQDYYEWLSSNPSRLFQFKGMVEGFAESRQPWVEIYPTERLLVDTDGSTNDEAVPILVDVGGGSGYDIEQFRRKHPQITHRLVLQDLPEVVHEAQVDRSICKIPHDFFQPQPIHHARAYFLHSVLHNWSDQKAKEVLLNLKPAMKPAYSRILVEEVVIRDNHPSQLSCAIDMRMLWNFGSGERSEREWQQLFSSVGMKINQIWYPMRDGASVIEVDVKDDV